MKWKDFVDRLLKPVSPTAKEEIEEKVRKIEAQMDQDLTSLSLSPADKWDPYPGQWYYVPTPPPPKDRARNAITEAISIDKQIAEAEQVAEDLPVYEMVARHNEAMNRIKTAYLKVIMAFPELQNIKEGQEYPKELKDMAGMLFKEVREAVRTERGEVDREREAQRKAQESIRATQQYIGNSGINPYVLGAQAGSWVKLHTDP